jgi:MFS family permease
MDGRTIDQQPAKAERATSVRWLVLLLIALASAVAYLTRHCLAVVNTTIQQDLQLSTEQMGWILSAYAIGYFFFQVPTGWLGTRFGTRGVLAALCVLWSLFTVWSAASFSFLSLLASRIAFGSAQAGLVPNSAQALNDWLPLNRRGFGSATIGAAMSVGGTVTMGATATLLDLGGFSWREVLLLYSLVGVVWAAAFVFVFRTKPEEHPWVNEAETLLIHGGRETKRTVEDSLHASALEEAGSRTGLQAPSEKHAGGWELAAHLGRSVSMWAICLQSLFRAAGYGLFVTWFPAFLEKGYGVTRESAGLLTMSPLIAVIVGTMLGGTVVDWLLGRTNSKSISRCWVGLGALGLCSFFTLSASWASSPEMLVAAVAVGAVFSGAGNPAAWAATMDIAGANTAIVMAVMNMAGTLGGIGIPIVVGYMIGDIERSGGDWNQVLYLVAGIYAAGSLCWLFIDPNRSVTGSPGS